MSTSLIGDKSYAVPEQVSATTEFKFAMTVSCIEDAISHTLSLSLALTYLLSSLLQCSQSLKWDGINGFFRSALALFPLL